MPVTILSTKVLVQGVDGSEYTDFMLANRGDLLSFTHDFKVEIFAVSSTKDMFRLNAKDGFVGDGWIATRSGKFGDFKVGDTVKLTNRNTGGGVDNRTIIAKRDNSTIQLDEATSICGEESDMDNVVITVTTPITAIRYNWNFIENSGPINFFSKVDGSFQELFAKRILPTTSVLMEFKGDKCYQIGGGGATHLGVVDGDIYTTNFRLSHDTSLLPYLSPSEIQDIIDGIKNKDFQNNKCLKGIFDIQAAKLFTDPNWIQSNQVTTVLGNTGDYRENFNTGITNYKIKTLLYKNAAGDVLTQLPLTTAETSFEFIVENTGDTPFSNTNTPYEVCFEKAPFDISEYQRNGRDIDHNFVNDRVFSAVGNGLNNGTAYGESDRQVLKQVKAEFISTSQIKVSGKILLLAGTIAVLKESDTPRYFLTLSVRNHLLAYNESDAVRLPVELNAFTIDYSDSGLIVFEDIFFERHPQQSVYNERTDTLIAMPEDEIVNYTRFAIDSTGRDLSKVILSSVKCSVVAFNSVTGDKFTLDTFTQALPNNFRPNGVQSFEFEQSRIFNIPVNELRKKIKIARNQSLDNAGKYYFEAIFPFMIRWEYWEALLKQAGQDDFFDPSQPNSGINHDWFRISDKLNWGIRYELLVIGTYDGKAQSWPVSKSFQIANYFSNPDWNPKTIKTFDPISNIELTDYVTDPLAPIHMMYRQRPTRVEAAFTSVTSAPNLSDTAMFMHMEVFEEGGIAGTRRLASKYAKDLNDGNWYSSIDLNDKLRLDLVDPQTVRGTSLTDPNNIPTNRSRFKIHARLFSPALQRTCVCRTDLGFVYDPLTDSCIRTGKSCKPGYTYDVAQDLCVKDTPSQTGAVWAFGLKQGIDWNNLDVNGDPTPYDGLLIQASEGCASACDDTGNLLFYTDGISLWNGANTLKASDLMGSPSSTNSALIKQLPGSTTIFYIFTVGSNTGGSPSNQFKGRYSVYDTSLSGGTGDFVSKNNLLAAGDAINYVEKISAITQGDKTWIIYKDFGPQDGSNLNSRPYISYPLTSAGIGTRVINTVFSGPDFTNAQGYTKFNPIAIATNIYQFVECLNTSVNFCNFDFSTGLFTAPQNIFSRLSLPAAPYGAEFSPDGTKMYMSEGRFSGAAVNCNLYWFDVSSNSPAAIVASKTIVHSSLASGYGALQLGPNGRILMAGILDSDPNLQHLSVIYNPNGTAATCDFRESFILLNVGVGQQVQLGLPTFDSSQFTPYSLPPEGGTEYQPCDWQSDSDGDFNDDFNEDQNI